MSREDGGPAFPWGGDVLGGMTLRDYLAAKAMQSLIIEGAGYNSDPKQIRPMCKTAVAWADELLLALAARKENTR